MAQSGIPRVKLEYAPNGEVKQEAVDQDLDVDMTSPQGYEDDKGDELEDGGDLDFTNAQDQLWLTQIPHTLWETWSTLGLDDEVEIGTIRVEGSQDNPQRISLKLHPLESVKDEFKEYILRPIPNDRRRSQHPGQALIFSEQHLPGHKPKPFSWENIDEDGNPGQGRSQLYERNKRDQKRKENGGKFEPYARKPIPKKTALAGAVVKELEAAPVRNKEYYEIEDKLERAHLAQNVKAESTRIVTDPAEMKRIRVQNSIYMATDAQKAAHREAKQEKKQRQQGGPAIMTVEELKESLFDLFREYRIWAIGGLKDRTGQSLQFLNQVLSGIAIKHTSGDWGGRWELKDELKSDSNIVAAAEMAPDSAGDSEMDRSGVDDGDDNGDIAFEDVPVK